ncbi:MAG: hypothetical protein ACR2P4_01860 [Gammaproteobacteria bacterium]
MRYFIAYIPSFPLAATAENAKPSPRKRRMKAGMTGFLHGGGFFLASLAQRAFLVLYSLAMLLSMVNLSFIITRRTAHGARRTA